MNTNHNLSERELLTAAIVCAVLGIALIVWVLA